MQPITVHLISLGCPKNLVDSEQMLGTLAEEEKRLRSELVAAEIAVKELRAELGRVQSGIKSLSGKGGGAAKRRKGRGARESVASEDSHEPEQHHEHVPEEHVAC